jgi:hypothetical protein
MFINFSVLAMVVGMGGQPLRFSVQQYVCGEARGAQQIFWHCLVA